LTQLEVACSDADATRRLGSRLARLVEPGDVILLEGDLGAGKTTFTQGLASALGVDSAVTSPTFTLMNISPTDAGFDLVHVDVYRLERLSEVVDLALAEMLDDGAVVVVEWGERAVAALRGEYLFVSLLSGSDEGRRVARFRFVGSGWERRRPDLEATVAANP
jgi:tRNA threonylcarbamoyladenosine biosynthesis protein TsaE